jgi:KpsF/GutQ family protein
MNNQIIEIVKNTWETEALSISSLINDIDELSILSAIEVLGNMKGKAIVSGCGTSGAAAKKIAHSLCCVERPAAFLSPTDAVHGALGMLQREDVLILITKGGNTMEVVNLIHACKEKGAYLIGVTENPDSILAKQADLLLKVKVRAEPCPFNMLATASTMAVIAVFDAICIALMNTTGYTREQFALIHPGGAVGERLMQTKVSHEA